MAAPIPEILWATHRRLSMAERAAMIEFRATLAGLDRELVKPSIIHLFTPADLAARDTREGMAVILSKMEKALAAEAARGRDQHWAYNFNRHQLLVSLIAEISADLESRRAA